MAVPLGAIDLFWGFPAGIMVVALGFGGVREGDSLRMWGLLFRNSPLCFYSCRRSTQGVGVRFTFGSAAANFGQAMWLHQL